MFIPDVDQIIPKHYKTAILRETSATSNRVDKTTTVQGGKQALDGGWKATEVTAKNKTVDMTSKILNSAAQVSNKLALERKVYYIQNEL